MDEQRVRRRRGYAVALGATAVTVAARLSFWQVIGDAVPHMLFFPAVMFAAYFGGFRPGLLATILGAFFANAVFTPPHFIPAIKGVNAVMALPLFVLVALTMSALCESLHRTRSRLVAEERERAAASLRETEERFLQLSENIREIFWVMSLDGRVLYISPGYEELWGRTRDSLYGVPIGTRIATLHPDDRAAQSALHELNLQGMPSNSEFRVLRPDGVVRWVRSRVFPINDDAGNLSRIVGLCEDITDRKRSEELLRESEHRWRSLAEALPQLVWTASPDGACDYFSTQWRAYTGVAEEELIGWRWLEVLHPDDREATRRKWLKAVRRQGVYEVEYRIRSSGGAYGWFTARGVPVRGASGSTVKWFGTCTDTSAAKRLEDELRVANNRLSLAVRGSNLSIWEFDMPDGIIENSRATFINAWEPLGYDLGTAPADFPGALAQAIHPGDQERVSQSVRAALTGENQVYEAEYRVRRRDGSVRWHLARGVVVRDAERRPIRLLGSSADITDLKAAEDALRKSEHRFRTFVDHATDAFFLHDETFRVLDVNRRACESLGYSREELLGQNPIDFDPDISANTLAESGRRLRAGEAIVLESRHRRKDGTLFPVEIRGQAFQEGGTLYAVSLARDITERKHAEEELRNSEERFRGTFENAAVGIAHCDLSGRYLRVNERYCEIIGFAREELLGKTFQEITHRDDLATSLDNFNPLRRRESSSYSQEKRLVHKNGESIWVHVSVSLQYDAAGEPLHTIAIVQDISRRKHLEDDLRRARDVAEAANRAKDEFLANVSHEIRTPMNAILGMTELVLDTELREDQRQCLRTVKSAADNLLGIINDLLDFSKIEAGKMELDPGDFSLRTTIGETLRALATRAHQKGLELVSEIAPDVPDSLVGDVGRLRQVLLNLIGNAIKFTSSGEVIVRLQSAESPSPTEAAVRFAVKDTGIGIPAEIQGRIFRAFEQEDTSTTRKYGGTGLGLSIAARLVGLMGGSISVESQSGQGSTFAFTARFGRRPGAADAPAAATPVLLRGLRLLVVDDNSTNRRILEETLRGWQMRPDGVGDAVSATGALWHALTRGEPYPLVLLDARMPDTDGLALAARIREWPALSATRMILLTSGDRPGDLARSRELRIEAHLLKPVQPEELLDTIYRVMSRPDGEAPPAVNVLPISRSVPLIDPLHILVAEDNDFNARMIEQVLVRRGHRVTLAANGREALDLVAGGNFDALLLDVHMPEMDGFQVIGEIRRREQSGTSHLPVIALTARSRSEDRERCLAAGMDEFLSKPVTPGELLAALSRLIGAGRLPHESQSLLTPSVLLTACENDGALLQRLCRSFRERVPEHLESLATARRNSDLKSLRETAHKLCGMLATFSTPAGELASEVEDRAAAGERDVARELTSRLESIAVQLLQQVEGLTLDRLPVSGQRQPRS